MSRYGGRRFEVIGDDVLGDASPMLMAHPQMGYPMGHPVAGPMVQLAPAADWRSGQVAPGVMLPDVGLVPLPLTAQQNGGTFTSAQTAITFSGQLQKPYRAERLIIQRVNSGTSAAAPLIQGQIFVGTDLQQAEVQSMPLEAIGSVGAFGTRLTLMQAPPGVLIRILSSLIGAVTGTDNIIATMLFLGQVVH